MKKIRKVRSDKKREVRPTVSGELKECLFRYAYLTNQPVKDACLFLIKKGLCSDVILSDFQKIMIHNFSVDSHVYIGNRQGVFPVKLIWGEVNGRVTMKLPATVYDELNRLSFAVGLSVSATSALMLKAVISNYALMDGHLMYYDDRLDKKRFRMLQQFLYVMIEDNGMNEKNLPL